MPKLTFTDAQLTNLEMEGVAVLFTYTVDDSSESQAINVLGSPNSWAVNEQEKTLYLQVLFTGTIAYLKDYWETYQELPINNKQIISESDFPPYQKVQTGWEGSTLDLME